ncbi:MAG: RuvX/YqgF family protein, partial [Candidatus Caldatribacteriaceae bacterium]
MKRVMALDIGEKRTGIAFNQGGSIAFPYRVLEGKGDIDALLDIARELGAEEIVIGFPLRTDGSIGEKAKQIETLKERIEKV